MISLEPLKASITKLRAELRKADAAGQDLSPFFQQLEELSRGFEDHPEGCWLIGGVHDAFGNEHTALRWYRGVLKQGVESLPAEDQLEFLFSLGSTLRNTGDFEESAHILEEGTKRFPRTKAFHAMLALTRFSQGQFEASAKLFAQAMLAMKDDQELQMYQRALDYYVGEILKA